MHENVIFAARDLLPHSWKDFVNPGPVRLFNPGLLKDGGGWIFAYRVVGPDLIRRIAICRLDRDFNVLEGSQIPLSNHVTFQTGRGYSPRHTTWFADPRLYRLAGRVFLYWNSGWHDPLNHQFLQELDPVQLQPVGSPREIRLSGARCPIEKNWMLFGEGPFYAVYSVSPHRILQFSVEGSGDIEFSDVVSRCWNHGEYGRHHGGIRGGAPPQLVAGRYYAVCHAISDAPEGYRYAPVVYRFSSVWPFLPTDAPIQPLHLSNPFGAATLYEKLNPVVGEVIYPCGAVFDQNRWVISYGINDEHCAVAAVADAEIQDCFRPIDHGIRVDLFEV